MNPRLTRSAKRLNMGLIHSNSFPHHCVILAVAIAAKSIASFLGFGSKYFILRPGLQQRLPQPAQQVRAQPSTATPLLKLQLQRGGGTTDVGGVVHKKVVRANGYCRLNERRMCVRAVPRRWGGSAGKRPIAARQDRGWTRKPHSLDGNTVIGPSRENAVCAVQTLRRRGAVLA